MATANGLQMARFYPHLVDLKPQKYEKLKDKKTKFYPHLVDLKQEKRRFDRFFSYVFYRHLVDLKPLMGDKIRGTHLCFIAT